MNIRTYNTSEGALRALSDRLISLMQANNTRPFHLALSGGETAQMLFKVWREEYRDKINWDTLRFYWVDERCVDPGNNQSNFKYADELLFYPLGIPANHVHRIFGEQAPELEAERYSEHVKWELPGYANFPRFDCIILGIGNDGHVASIFPAIPKLLTDNRCYAVASHPVTGQKRITMTGVLILRGNELLLPVIGFAKTDILRRVVGELRLRKPVSPAAYVLSHAISATIYTNCKIE